MIPRKTLVRTCAITVRANKHNLTCQLPLSKKSKNPSSTVQNLPLHYVVSPKRMILLHQHQGHLRRRQHFKSLILKYHCAHRWLQHLCPGHRADSTKSTGGTSFRNTHLWSLKSPKRKLHASKGKGL